MKIHDRIRELRRVPASALLPNPKNWRIHSAAQRNALHGVLAEVGYADALLVRELEDGSLMLIDGHLRAETTPDMDVPVLVLDVTEAEADKLLATIDPLAGMADANPAALDELLRGIETGNQDLANMLTGLAEENGLIPKEQKARECAIDPEYSILIKCDDEIDQRIMIEELDSHGIHTRALCIGWPQPPPIERTEDKPLSVDEKRIIRKTTIKQSARTKQLAGIYDLPPKTESSHEWIVKFTLDRPWNIGLIVGPSGTNRPIVLSDPTSGQTSRFGTQGVVISSDITGTRWNRCFNFDTKSQIVCVHRSILHCWKSTLLRNGSCCARMAARSHRKAYFSLRFRAGGCFQRPTGSSCLFLNYISAAVPLQSKNGLKQAIFSHFAKSNAGITMRWKPSETCTLGAA